MKVDKGYLSRRPFVGLNKPNGITLTRLDYLDLEM